MRIEKDTIVNSIVDLARIFGDKNLRLLGKSFYDDTECGVNTEYLTINESHYYSDDHYAITKDLPNHGANEIVGIRFHTIVEGYDAEFSADPIYFPCEWDEIDEAIAYLEDLVDDFLNEAE